MNPHKITISALFTMQSRHLIPIFQRQYVWDERDQWAPLWDDITAKARELLTPHAGMFQPRKHFMGAVVLRAIPPSGLEFQAFEVIDGQQRLTTMQVLLIALRDYSRQRELGPSLAMLTGMTQNPYLSGKEHEQLKVVPTTRDRADFQDVFEAGSPEDLRKRRPVIKQKYARRDEPPPRLLGAYYFFFNAIAQFAEASDSEDEEASLPDQREIAGRVEALVRAITQQLELVRIDLDQEDDPQVIFETLNARGVKLWPGDLVRNYVFLEATRRYGSQQHVIDLYERYWKQYDETASAAFWKEPVRQGRLVNPRFELFLFHFLTSQLQKLEADIQLAHLYRAFGEWWTARGITQPGDIDMALAEVQRYSELYRRIFASNDADRLAVFGRRMRVLDNSTVYPLILFLCVERGHETEAELDGILADIESYVVRRVICGLTTKGYNRIFLKMIIDLRKGPPITHQIVRQYLSNLVGVTAEWPNDHQLHERWLTTPVYQTLRQGRVAMVLEALEWAHYTSKQEHPHPPSSTIYSVEHIMPQSTTEQDWPLTLPENVDDSTRQAIVTTRDVLKHTFGNLTLVTGPMNSTLSNRAFAVKQQDLNGHSILMLNKYFAHCTTWDETAIRARGAHLFALAQQIWPAPEHSTPNT